MSKNRGVVNLNRSISDSPNTYSSWAWQEGNGHHHTQKRVVWQPHTAGALTKIGRLKGKYPYDRGNITVDCGKPIIVLLTARQVIGILYVI